MLDQYLQNNCTQQEKAELNKLLNDPENELQLLNFLEEKWNDKDFSSPEIQPARSKEMLQNIFDTEPAQAELAEQKVRLIPRWRSSVAIILILLCVSGAYLFFSKQKAVTGDILAESKVQPDSVLPGSVKATLALSDGSQLLLDSHHTGKIAREGNTDVLSSGSSLSYSMVGVSEPLELKNKITTKRGEAYSVQLPDGSMVWLNSASSLKFPVGFSTDVRKVEVTGEAYFEVAKDPSKPFQVSVRNMIIQVLGTHFNVNAYDDEEKLKTTLIEGSVELISGNKRVKIRPGQQGTLTAKGNFEVKNLDEPEEVATWKDGAFAFNDDDLEVVLRQVARWYNLDLVYKSHVSHKHFTGGFQKDFPISTIISSLSAYANLKLEGRKLIVSQ